MAIPETRLCSRSRALSSCRGLMLPCFLAPMLVCPRTRRRSRSRALTIACSETLDFNQQFIAIPKRFIFTIMAAKIAQLYDGHAGAFQPTDLDFLRGVLNILPVVSIPPQCRTITHSSPRVSVLIGPLVLNGRGCSKLLSWLTILRRIQGLRQISICNFR